MWNLKVNSERLWASLMALAEIGATPKGGVCRLAASDLDAAARRLFIRWCEEAGCMVRIDKIGNIFARRRGRNPSLPPVMTGSHIDTQSTGGKFDGAYGVMAATILIDVYLLYIFFTRQKSRTDRPQPAWAPAAPADPPVPPDRIPWGVAALPRDPLEPR